MNQVGPDLPAGWVRSTISECCQVVSGATPKTGDAANWGGEINWLTPDDLSKNRAKVVSSGARTLTQTGFDSCSTSLLPAGTVLFSSRAPIGYVAIAGGEVCTNQGFKSAIPDESLRSEFLYWQLQYLTPDIRSRASGTTFLEISKKGFAATEITLPPLEEQERIVEVLEEHLSRLDAALANIQAVRTKAAQFRRSLLHAGTTGELFEPGIPVHSLPDGWVEARVGDLLDGIEAGKSFACDGRPAEDGELGVVKVSAMTWGEFDPAENKALSPGTEVDDRWRVGDGDLLLSRANTVDYVGACVLVRGNHPNLVLSDKSLRLLPCDGVDHRWLLYALRAPLLRAQIEEVATGTKESMRNISQAKIRALKVSVPPREQQGRIADHLAMYMSQLDATLAAADRVEAQCAALRRSLLHAAFTGKLTEEWRETAGV